MKTPTNEVKRIEDVDLSVYQDSRQTGLNLVPTHVIRIELENMQGLILDSEERVVWNVLSAELRRRGEPRVRWQV